MNQQLRSGKQSKRLKSKKTNMLRSIGKQFGESVESVLKMKRKAIWWEGFSEKGGFKPGMKE